MEPEPTKFAEQEVLTLSQEHWELARMRASIIGRLAALEIVGHQSADEAAQKLGISRRQVYVLIQ